ncbi:MAG: glycoside hydrolase family 172 protein [Planctomycetota bacterium]
MRPKSIVTSPTAAARPKARPAARAALVLAAWAIAVSGLAGDLDDLAKPHDGRSMRSTSTAVDENGDYAHSNNDNSRVAPGATKVVLDAQGPGTITHMWFTFLGPEPHPWAPDGSANHQEILLRIYYDGSKRPGVEAPLGDFFANSFGKRSEVISVPVVVEDADSYNCFWRMPFRESVRVEIVNQSSRKLNLLYYNIDWIKLDALAEDTPYFYAQYRQEYPVQQGQDYVILETEGKGHYVGTVLSVRTRSPSWFGEGDEKIYIDGEPKPSIWGTGTEDYFLSAWGLKTTSTPYFGTPYFDQWGIIGCHTSAYRWHVHDPIVFNQSVKVTIEHWGWISPDENPNGETHSWNERQDDFSSVAFWYQTGEPTFTARAPGAEERTLPNLDVTFPAKHYVDEEHHGPGEARVQTNLGFYPEGQLFYRPEEAENGWVEIPFTVEEKEPRRLVIKGTRADDYGRYQPSLNGVNLGPPIDFYDDRVTEWQWHLLDFWPDPGEYTLRLECVGKNAKSTGHFVGIESVRLRERRPRVKEWARDKDKDWQKEPTLYR